MVAEQQMKHPMANNAAALGYPNYIQWQVTSVLLTFKLPFFPLIGALLPSVIQLNTAQVLFLWSCVVSFGRSSPLLPQRDSSKQKSLKISKSKIPA